MAGRWTLSIVSHGHAQSIARQLPSLAALPALQDAELILTLNLAEEPAPALEAWPGSVRVVRNRQAQSYARNHNAAAQQAQGDFFACVDPDLQWLRDPFPALAEWLAQADAGLAAPTILDPAGTVADHARPPPTPWAVIRRRLRGHVDGLPASAAPQPVPWLAGLFLAARRACWAELGGFDERYRLYAEDVELGLRCWVRGRSVTRLPVEAAVHPARRASKSRLQPFAWHLRGLLRLWASSTWRAYSRIRPTGVGPQKSA